MQLVTSRNFNELITQGDFNQVIAHVMLMK